MLLTSERALRSGDPARAASGYAGAVPMYRKAEPEAAALRRDAEQAIARATPVVNALATRPQAGRAATSLARAESGYAAMDYVVARLAALDAEQVGVAAGVAPPSPQPAESRPGIDVLLQDLERAVSSERVGNLQTLMPGMADKRSEEHTSELQSLAYLVCRLLLEKKKNNVTVFYLRAASTACEQST